MYKHKYDTQKQTTTTICIVLTFVCLFVVFKSKDYIKVRRCVMISNETPINQSSNEADVQTIIGNIAAFNNKKNIYREVSYKSLRYEFCQSIQLRKLTA